jgi:hypothetical protein
MIRRFYRLSGVTALLLVGVLLGYAMSDVITDLRQMFVPPAPETEAKAAWADFTHRIDALGNRILEDDFPSASDRDRAEGIRHLTNVLVEGLRWEFDHGGVEPTSLMVSNTDSTAWGAPNVDNDYLRARIDGASSYTLYGNVAGLHEIAIQTNKGDMHQGQIGASETIDLSRLTIDTDGNFALHISPEPREGDWLRLDPEHTSLSIRTYLLDWGSTDLGQFYLTNAETEGLAPTPLSEAEAAARLGRAASWIEANIVGWNRWFGTMLRAVTDNEPMAPRSVAGGSSTLLYGGVPFRLDEGMAMVIEIDDPRADYFSLQTYRRGWYNPGDFANRQTSLNSAQTHVGSDGRIRFVAAAEDPGVPNWLDTEAHAQGLIVYRFIKAENPPLARVDVVPFSEVGSRLPADTPVVTTEQRRAAISKRQRHVQHRFHN